MASMLIPISISFRKSPRLQFPNYFSATTATLDRLNGTVSSSMSVAIDNSSSSGSCLPSALNEGNFDHCVRPTTLKFALPTGFAMVSALPATLELKPFRHSQSLSLSFLVSTGMFFPLLRSILTTPCCCPTNSPLILNFPLELVHSLSCAAASKATEANKNAAKQIPINF